MRRQVNLVSGTRPSKFAVYVRGIIAACCQELRSMLTPLSILFPLFNALTMAVLLGWIVGRSKNSSVVSYALVGAGLAQVWAWGLWRISYSATEDYYWGMLDFLISRRCPLAVIYIGKFFAILIFNVVLATTIVLTIAAAASHSEPITHSWEFAMGIILALSAIISMAMLIAPVSLLIIKRGSILWSVLPLVGLLTGFMFPAKLLPHPLREISLLVPTTYAMQLVAGSLRVTGASNKHWLAMASILLTLLYAWLAAATFRRCEEMIRRDGL